MSRNVVAACIRGFMKFCLVLVERRCDLWDVDTACLLVMLNICEVSWNYVQYFTELLLKQNVTLTFKIWTLPTHCVERDMPVRFHEILSSTLWINWQLITLFLNISLGQVFSCRVFGCLVFGCRVFGCQVFTYRVFRWMLCTNSICWGWSSLCHREECNGITIYIKNIKAN